MPDINGTDGNNTLVGSGQADTIMAFAGSDTVNGGNGNDTISGGEGSDLIGGGNGDDVLYGFGASDVQASSGDILLQEAVNGLAVPVFACSAPGDPDRMFVVEKGGTIRIVDPATGAVGTTPFLDVSTELSTSGEQGLLGLAFHPSYETNGKFFVYLNNAAGDIEVRSYTRSTEDPDVADEDSGDLILEIPHPVNANHNGGWIAFGPDGYLYLAVGDGGSGGDPLNNAQNKNVLLGKMLRIDVDGDDFLGDASRDYAIPDSNPFANAAGADEIWAYGLRNPWRNSFDRLTGDLYIADVGQGSREEVNFQNAGSTGGENYGWKVKEGTIVYDDTIPGNPPADDPILVDPVIDYEHVPAPDGGESITGGYVYRGTGLGMQGAYFYADFITRQIWSFRMVDGEVVDAVNRTAQIALTGSQLGGIGSFAEDGHGNLYLLSLNGRIHKLTPQVGAGDSADTIRGGNGNDSLYGGAGDDLLVGAADNDLMRGGAQKDQLNGGTGNDNLAGGKGDDRLIGGAGTDTLAGNAGVDFFIFKADDGADTIADFVDNKDTIRLVRDLGVTTVSQALALATETGGDVVFSFGGGEVLTVRNTTIAALTDDLLV